MRIAREIDLPFLRPPACAFIKIALSNYARELLLSFVSFSASFSPSLSSPIASCSRSFLRRAFYADGKAKILMQSKYCDRGFSSLLVHTWVLHRLYVSGRRRMFVVLIDDPSKQDGDLFGIGCCLLSQLYRYVFQERFIRYKYDVVAIRYPFFLYIFSFN